MAKDPHDKEVPLEGACEGSVACSTCHCVLPQQIYSSLEDPTDEEEDCLDLAPGLTETSRLGCKVAVHDGFEGAVIDLPANTINFYVDGFVPNQQPDDAPLVSELPKIASNDKVSARRHFRTGCRIQTNGPFAFFIILQH